MNIGQFKRENGVIAGSIVSPFGILQNVAFEAIQQKGNGPDYIITTEAGELGAAWKKTSERGNAYLSVSIRSPFIPGYQVFCALVESNRDAGNFALVWSEPKQAEAA